MAKTLYALERVTGRKVVAAVCMALLLTLGAAATAQFGRGGPQLDPEKQEAAWGLQVAGVAKELGLSGEDAGKMSEAYDVVRKSYQEARQDLFSGGGGRGAFQELQAISDEERAKLKSALSEFLSEEQVDKAMPSLGSFNRQWDRFVDALAGYELDDEKQHEALAFVKVYVVDSEKARSLAMMSGDFQSIRSSNQELKETLDGQLAKILSEDHLTKWKAATASRGGRGGRFGGGGGGGFGGGGGGVPHGDGSGAGHN